MFWETEQYLTDGELKAKIKIVYHPFFNILPESISCFTKKRDGVLYLSTSSQILHLLLSVIFHLYNLSLQFKIMFIILYWKLWRYVYFVVSKLVLNIAVQSCLKRGIYLSMFLLLWVFLYFY